MQFSGVNNGIQDLTSVLSSPVPLGTKLPPLHHQECQFAAGDNTPKSSYHHTWSCCNFTASSLARSCREYNKSVVGVVAVFRSGSLTFAQPGRFGYSMLLEHIWHTAKSLHYAKFTIEEKRSSKVFSININYSFTNSVFLFGSHLVLHQQVPNITSGCCVYTCGVSEAIVT